MGFRGLRNIIKGDRLLSNYRLQNTKLVIDAKNVIMSMIFSYLGSIRKIHDNTTRMAVAEYGFLYRLVKEFVENLLRCGIDPYFVFDGDDKADDPKLAHNLKKMQESVTRLRKNQQIEPRGPLVYETTKAVLLDMGIPFVTCEYEADASMVDIANGIDFQCPLLSNDNDFFLYPLKHGFILFDYSEFMKTHHLHIRCERFLFDDFLRINRVLGCDVTLLSPLCSSDYIESSRFDPFLQTLGPDTSDPSERIKVALQWMSSCRKRRQDCLSGILTSPSLERDSRIAQDLHRALNAASTGDAMRSQSFSEYFRLDVEARRKKKFQCLDVTPAMNEAEFLQPKVRLGCLLEDENKPSVFFCSATIRQAGYGIRFKELQLSGTQGTVLEFMRRQNGASYTNRPEWLTGIPGYAEVSKDILINEVPIPHDMPSAKEVPKLNIDDRMRIFRERVESVGMPFDKIPAGTSEFVLSCIVYWMKHVKNLTASDKLAFVQNMVLCHILLGSEVNFSPSMGKKLFELQDISLSKENKEFRANMHVILEYQSCLYGALLLNQMLLYPLGIPNPVTMVNSTMILNLMSTEFEFDQGIRSTQRQAVDFVCSQA